MIEVKATILHRSVFIPEEKLVCEIKFTNKSQKDHASAIKQLSHQRHSSDTRVIAPGSWNKDISMNAKINNNPSTSIAYASAQIYCQCNLNQRKFRIPPNFSSNKFDKSSKHTSFSSDQGECFYLCAFVLIFYIYIGSECQLAFFKKLCVKMFFYC